MDSSLYSLAVNLKMNASGFTGAAQSAIRILAQLSGQTEKAFLGTEKLGQSLKAAGMIMGGMLVAGAGLGILRVLDSMIQKAVTLTTVLTNVNQKLGINPLLNPGGANTVLSATMNAGMAYGYGPTQESNIINKIVQTGFVGPKNISTIFGAKGSGGVLAAINSYAYEMQITRGIAPAQSAEDAIKFSHAIGQYNLQPNSTGPGMAYALDRMGRGLAISSGSPSQFVTAVSQLKGTSGLYGRTAADHTRFIDDATMLAVLASQTGQQGRFGTQVSSAIIRTLGGSTARSATQLGAINALQAQGGGDFYNASTNTFKGVGPFINIIGNAIARTNNPRLIGQEIVKALGSVANRAVGILSDPGTMQQMKLVSGYLKDGQFSSSKINDALIKTPGGQELVIQGNMDRLTTIIGLDLIPAFVHLLQAILPIVKALNAFTDAHSSITKFLAGLALVGTAFMIIGGLVSVFLGALQSLAIVFKWAQAIMGVLETVVIGLMVVLDIPVELAIGAVVAAFLLLAAILVNMDNIIHAVGQAFNWFGQQVGNIIKFLGFTPTHGSSSAGYINGVPVRNGGGGGSIHGMAGVSIHIEHLHGTDEKSAQMFGQVLASHLNNHLFHGSTVAIGTPQSMRGY